MAVRILCDFGKEVKKRLVDLGKTQKWLISEVRIVTGLYVDRSPLGNVLTGKNRNPKIIKAVEQILKM